MAALADAAHACAPWQCVSGMHVAICYSKGAASLCRQNASISLKGAPHVQLKIRTLVVSFYTMSIALLWFVKMQSCMSYVFTWYGMLPLQVCSSLPADDFVTARQIRALSTVWLAWSKM